jgi:hypothetical protein
MENKNRETALSELESLFESEIAAIRQRPCEISYQEVEALAVGWENDPVHQTDKSKVSAEFFLRKQKDKHCWLQEFGPLPSAAATFYILVREVDYCDRVTQSDLVRLASEVDPDMGRDEYWSSVTRPRWINSSPENVKCVFDRMDSLLLYGDPYSSRR